jgi:hypothetical protein
MKKAGNIYIVSVRNIYETFWKYIVTVTLKGYFFNSRLFIKWLTFIILEIGGRSRLSNRYPDTLRKSNRYRIESDTGGIAHHYSFCRFAQKYNKN